MRFAVIGGDMRSARLAELLAAEKHECRACAFDKLIMDERVIQCETAAQAMRDAQCVILPLPVSLKEGLLNTPLSSVPHLLTGIFSAAEPGTVICGGRVDEKTAALAKLAGAELVDYYEREELAVANAAATAEGAVQILLEELPVTLSGTKCLVIGFGRIGKLLALKLSALGAHVTVSARKHGDKAWIKALGMQSADTGTLSGSLGGYDAIINTVPVRILGEEELRQVGENCLCLDLASKPGGMDINAAARLRVKVIWALGLPGEVAPVTSGTAILDTIRNILGERMEKECQS